MSMAAIFQFDCCKQLLVYGRHRGNEMFSLHLACNDCQKKSSCSFVMFVSDEKLGQPDARKRILGADEVVEVKLILSAKANRPKVDYWKTV